MKIGILTFHRVNNLGAVLQASALQYYIENNIDSCEIIDFIPNNEIPYCNLARRVLHRIKQIVTFPKSKNDISKERAFAKYRRKFLKVSSKKYYGDTGMSLASGKYEILVSGSDQILNLSLSGKSKSYYLDFDEKARKISYASSFGSETISDEEKDLVRNELPKFSELSVRERTGEIIIKELIGRTAELVLDPVFLLSLEDWKIRCKERKTIQTKFIFVYSMEVSSILEKLVQKLHDDTCLPVVVVRGGGQQGRIIGSEDSSCGPIDFLQYIRDAEYVVTNSFHGSAFSLIFGKKLYCVPHSTRNARIENLLDIVKCRNKMVINTEDYERYEIECSSQVDYLNPLVDSSKEYLKRCLTDF